MLQMISVYLPQETAEKLQTKLDSVAMKYHSYNWSFMLHLKHLRDVQSALALEPRLRPVQPYPRGGVGERGSAQLGSSLTRVNSSTLHIPSRAAPQLV